MLGTIYRNMSSRYPHVGGILHMSNAVPGQAFQHPSPTFPAQICYCLRFTSNYEAIEKLILRPPLKVDRSLPPEVVVWYFSSSKSLTPGGKPVPYQGFQFRGNTEFNGVKGCAGWGTSMGCTATSLRWTQWDPGLFSSA